MLVTMQEEQERAACPLELGPRLFLVRAPGGPPGQTAWRAGGRCAEKPPGRLWKAEMCPISTYH